MCVQEILMSDVQEYSRTYYAQPKDNLNQRSTKMHTHGDNPAQTKLAGKLRGKMCQGPHTIK